MCLLCLELSKDPEKGIKVQSLHWQEWKIEQIIEKHIFPLKYLTSNSWICESCWQVIRDFHTLYTHIQNAHAFFNSTLVKTEVQEIPDDVEEYVYVSETHLQQEAEHHMEVAMDQFFDNIISNEKAQLPLEVKLENDNAGTELSEEVTLPLISLRRNPIQKALLENNRNTTFQKNDSQKRKQTKAKEMETTSKNKSDDRAKGIKPAATEDCETDSGSDNQADKDDSVHSDDFNSPLNYNCKASTKRKEMDRFVAENFQMICGICLVPMETFGTMSAHSIKEHNQRGFVKCCNKKLFTRTLLVEHIRLHLDPEHFKCKQCGKLLGDRRSLKLHIKMHEKTHLNHTCDICWKSFARPSILRRHKYTHMPVEERKFFCDQCDKRYANNNLLMLHMRAVHLHSYFVVCDICGKEIKSKAFFDRHMLQHSELQTTVSCDICGLKLLDVRGLKAHKRAQHSQEASKEYKCHMCSKVCASHGALRQHVQYNHEMGYDFKCTVCGKAFKRACALREHMSCHTGTALYTCTFCPKTFNFKANMYTHRKRAHHQKWEEAVRVKSSGNLTRKTQKPSGAFGLT